MKNLVRGGALLLLSSLFVVIIFAQTKTETPLATANDSQPKIENKTTTETTLDKSNKTLDKADKSDIKDDDKKLVKTTALVSAKVAGISRGSFSASAYCFSGRTAMGHGVRRGLIAADPRVLPLGSKVTINAGPWSGTYLVSDTGGSIRGKKIDIWVPSCSEARKFGRRTVQVFSIQ